MISVMAQANIRAYGTEPFTRNHDYDVLLKTADPDEQELTALELLAEMVEAHRKQVGRFEAKALRNELYYHGDQFRDVNENSLEVEDLDWLSDVPQVYRNYLRPLINTYSARILKDRPDVVAYPNDHDGIDQMATKVSNGILYHTHQRLEIDDLLFRASIPAQCHGKVYLWHVWDPDIGPTGVDEWDYDENGDIVQVASETQPMGDVSWEIATIFDVATDGSTKVEDSTWCWRRTYVKRQEARSLLVDAGIDEQPQAIHYVDTFQGEKEGVEVYEVWHRPSPRIPDGCYFLVVGGYVVDYRETYPYEHGELPVSEWKIAERRNSSYGSTHVDDAVVIQRQINELVSVIQKLTRDCGRMLFVGHPAIINAIDSGNAMIPVANETNRTNNGWLEPPRPPPLLFAQLEELIRALYDVFGLNEILTGQENIRSGTSALQVQYLTELDSMKLAGSARSLGKALKRAWKQTLNLYQQFCAPERIEAIMGPGSAYAVQAYRDSDLGGVDVRLEPRSGIERYRSFEADAAQEEMVAGVIPPEEGQERRKTGLATTYAEHWAKRVVQEQIRAALQGATGQPPDSMVDPGLAQREIEIALRVAQGRLPPERMGALTELYQNYSQLAAQQMQQNMAASQQPQPAQQQPQLQPTAGLLQ